MLYKFPFETRTEAEEYLEREEQRLRSRMVKRIQDYETRRKDNPTDESLTEKLRLYREILSTL